MPEELPQATCSPPPNSVSPNSSAEGRPNKEIAANLFVTVKAVEANLTRIYAKFGIHSRTELARLLVHKSADAGRGQNPRSVRAAHERRGAVSGASRSSGGRI